jgi:hypothetical protein
MEKFELINSDEILEPETLRQLFPELSEIDREKLQVLKLIKSSNVIFEDFDTFENAVEVLNNVKPDIQKTEGCRPEWIWKALDIIYRISNKKLSHEVKEYIKWNFKEEGFLFYPPTSGIDNPLYADVIKIAKDGPFPLKEATKLNIQAIKYLKIMEYLKDE